MLKLIALGIEYLDLIKQHREISNNVVCATSKGSDQTD